jgi:hypothetical protein
MKAFLLALSLILMLGQAGAQFGSKVNNGDSDLGRYVIDIPFPWAIMYWDCGQNQGIYDSGDVVYLHNANQGPGVGNVRVNDVRLTPPPPYNAGDKVKAIDSDMNMPLSTFPSPGVSINFADRFGSPLYDLDDPVYIHQRNIPPGVPAALTSLVRINDIRLTQTISQYSAGSKVQNFDQDAGWQLAQAKAPLNDMIPVGLINNVAGSFRIRVFDANGNGLYDDPDPMFLTRQAPQLDKTPFGFVSVNDVRLTNLES